MYVFHLKFKMRTPKKKLFELWPLKNKDIGEENLTTLWSNDSNKYYFGEQWQKFVEYV